MSYSADKKPGELTALTSLATDDVFIVGDTSDVSEVAKHITKANLITDLGASLGGINRTVVVTSGDVTAGATAKTDYVYKLAGLHTVTLPTAVGNTNQYDISNLHSANNSIATTSSQTIHGSSAPITIVPNQALTLQSDGTNWIIK